MLRVPILQAGEVSAPGPTAAATTEAASTAAQAPDPPLPEAGEGGISFLGRLPSANGYIGNPTVNALPAAMLDHIRLYRRVQLNWQAYDAYARVSLFCGANSLLYSCLYWALGSFLGGQHAGVAAIAVALVFATIQVMLTKLDLRLRAWHLRRIALLLFSTPVTTTIGMILYPEVTNGTLGPFSAQRLLMNLCAIVAHVLHFAVAFMVLLASWPDDDEEALLPGKFRSTLYLDVFGWLLNPTGPGARTSAAREEEDEVRSFRSFMSESGHEPQEVRGSPTPSPTTRPSVVEAVRPRRVHNRWVSPSARGDGSGRLNTSRRSSRLQVPHAHGATFTEGATQRLLEEPQGQRQGLWHRFRRSFNSFAGGDSLHENGVAFSPELEREVRRTFPSPTSSSRGARSRAAAPAPESGAQVGRYGGNDAVSFEDMQAFTDPAADTASTFLGQAPRHVHSNKNLLPGQRPWSAFKRGTQIIVLLWAASVVWAIARAVLNVYDAYVEHKHTQTTAQQEILRPQLTQSLCEGIDEELRSKQILQWMDRRGRQGRVLDHGCGWQRAQQVALQCDERATCMAAILAPGGRSVRVCRAEGSRSVLTLTPMANWPLAPGLTIRALALHLPGGTPPRVFARTKQDALLMLEPRGRRLQPLVEVEPPQNGSHPPETLLVLNGLLFSDQAAEGGGLTAYLLQTGVKFHWPRQEGALKNLTSGAFCRQLT